MKLPSFKLPEAHWSNNQLSNWEKLVFRAEKLQKGAGKGSNFERLVEELLTAIQNINGAKVRQIISTRAGARAITDLWLHNEVIRKSLNSHSLELLIKCQQPRLSQIPLLNLVNLYFHYFDEIDSANSNKSIKLIDVLGDVIALQLKLLPNQKRPNSSSVLHNLKRNADELLARNGPLLVIKRAREKEVELDIYFKQVGLVGYDQGRFGDICRAIYYLDILKRLPVGEYHKVFAELEKPTVNMAIYEVNLRIGHKALEILIDRSLSDPGENWRNFILNIAGDPRIASSSLEYKQWWKPLGTERIEKVRGWLSREDLKLFLKAVEQYGEESGDKSLQRMFPARKKFLEGLFEQNIIKSTRLMLGTVALEGVRHILGSEMRSSYINLGSGMNDKAVIYLNCGNFHVIQGSHNFKIWLYLAMPSPRLTSYNVTSLDHYDLTHRIPAEYQEEYPELPFEDITHHQGTWRNNVIQFLAGNGIELDIEMLMTPEDYDAHIKRFGIPVISRTRY